MKSNAEILAQLETEWAATGFLTTQQLGTALRIARLLGVTANIR